MLLRTTRTVTEHLDFTDMRGDSIGQYVDRMIGGAVGSGDTLIKVEVELADEDWLVITGKPMQADAKSKPVQAR